MDLLSIRNSRFSYYNGERNHKNNTKFVVPVEKEKILEGQDECYRNVTRLLTSVCDYAENTLVSFSMKCKVGSGIHMGSLVSVNVNCSVIDVNIMLCNATPDSVDIIRTDAESILNERFSEVRLSIEEVFAK
ncbi:hypothetical protein ACXWYY_002943 [Enterobacter hormaechei]